VKIQTVYNRIDRVIYEFDRGDIQRALIEKAEVKYERGKRIGFDIDVDEDGKITATITVVWETPIKEVGATE